MSSRLCLPHSPNLKLDLEAAEEKKEQLHLHASNHSTGLPNERCHAQ